MLPYELSIVFHRTVDQSMHRLTISTRRRFRTQSILHLRVCSNPNRSICASSVHCIESFVLSVLETFFCIHKINCRRPYHFYYHAFQSSHTNKTFDRLILQPQPTQPSQHHLTPTGTTQRITGTNSPPPSPAGSDGPPALRPTAPQPWLPLLLPLPLAPRPEGRSRGPDP